MRLAGASPGIRIQYFEGMRYLLPACLFFPCSIAGLPALCYSAGFGETGPEGKLLESELSSIAKDMPILIELNPPGPSKTPT